MRRVWCRHVLFFERDVAFCAAPTRPLAWFVRHDWDFVGAPFEPSNAYCQSLASDPAECCCNSGLSLVNTRRFAAALATAHERELPLDKLWALGLNDMFLVAHRAEGAGLFRMPDSRLAQLFSVEGRWDRPDTTPFGVHKPWTPPSGGDGVARPFPSHWEGTVRRLLQQCPEAKRLCKRARREHEQAAAPAAVGIAAAHRAAAKMFAGHGGKADAGLAGPGGRGGGVARAPPLGPTPPPPPVGSSWFLNTFCGNDQ